MGKAGNPSPCRGHCEEVGSVAVGECMGSVVRLASVTCEFGDLGPVTSASQVSVSLWVTPG